MVVSSGGLLGIVVFLPARIAGKSHLVSSGRKKVVTVIVGKRAAGKSKRA